MPPKRTPPGPGQESVWDYPRPPRIAPDTRHVRVVLNGITIADTNRAIRILETSHPPAFYLPPDDCALAHFHQIDRTTFCEFKGAASYYTISVGERSEVAAAWYYPHPSPGYEAITGYIALYPGRMDACYVGDELVQAQAGDFYGGWITKEIVGPFKGAPGTWGW